MKLSRTHHVTVDGIKKRNPISPKFDVRETKYDTSWSYTSTKKLDKQQPPTLCIYKPHDGNVFGCFVYGYNSDNDMYRYYGDSNTKHERYKITSKKDFSRVLRNFRDDANRNRWLSSYLFATQLRKDLKKALPPTLHIRDEIKRSPNSSIYHVTVYGTGVDDQWFDQVWEYSALRMYSDLKKHARGGKSSSEVFTELAFKKRGLVDYVLVGDKYYVVLGGKYYFCYLYSAPHQLLTLITREEYLEATRK